MASHQEEISANIQSVRDQALAAVEAAEKTNVNLQKLIEYRQNLLKETKAKYNLE